MHRVEEDCLEKPFRKLDCEEEQKNIAITREVCGVKGERTTFFVY